MKFISSLFGSLGSFGGGWILYAVVFAVGLSAGGVGGFKTGQWSESTTILNLKQDKADLSDSINNSKTGWAVRQAQCQTNVATISSGFDRMAGDIRKLGDDTAAANAANAKLMATAATEARGARVRADQVLNLPRPAPAEACTVAAKILKGVTP